MKKLELRFSRVGDVEVPLPKYATVGAAGMDLRAALPEALSLAPGARQLIPSGLRVAIAPGHEIQLRPRSGLALKHGVTVLNAPGTIDSDYRGEIGILLINHGDAAVVIEPLQRIAQMVLAPVMQGDSRLVDTLDDTERGTGGYGSTGQK